MSRIKQRDTKPELKLRGELWRCGLRYRLKTQLPGKPDIVFPSKKVAIFVDGCFWHRCSQHFTLPKTRAEFWRKKIDDNVARDKKVNEQLASSGWEVCRFWEHEIREDIDNVVREILVKLDRCVSL